MNMEPTESASLRPSGTRISGLIAIPGLRPPGGLQPGLLSTLPSGETGRPSALAFRMGDGFRFASLAKSPCCLSGKSGSTQPKSESNWATSTNDAHSFALPRVDTGEHGEREWRSMRKVPESKAWEASE